MDRGEFLSILRESLEGCVPMDEVEKNIVFYRNYFEESEQSDREIIEELGDPRLIARTIIEAYKASKGPMADYYTEQARSEYSHVHSGQYDDSFDRTDGYSGGKPHWYQKTLRWTAVFLVLAVLVILAVTVVSVFIYVLPVVLLVIIIKMLMDYFKR